MPVAAFRFEKATLPRLKWGREQTGGIRPQVCRSRQVCYYLKAAIRCPTDDRGNAPHIGRSELQRVLP